jgi:hypothetical protein
MKLKILLLVILSSYITNAQKKYKKIESGKCKIEHTCRLEYLHDDFEDLDKFRIGFYETEMAKKAEGCGNTLTYIIDKNVDKNKVSKYILTLFGSKKGCSDKDSYVYIILKNGEKFKVENMLKTVHCGTSFLNIVLTEELLNKLTKNEILKIRVQYLDASEDFEISEKGQLNFIKNLECITNI